MSSVLGVLTTARIVAIAREFQVAIRNASGRDQLIEQVEGRSDIQLSSLLGWMRRDELKQACREHGLPDKGRVRDELTSRLLEAASTTEPTGSKRKTKRLKSTVDPSLPKKGEVVRVRQRHYLVNDVIPSVVESHPTRVDLTCIDDDNSGRQLSVLWEYELGARVIRPEASGLGEITRLDPPRHFAAYLHALKWNSVTATDPELFQSPFRSGIKLMHHQLTPLKKALALPRSNLFIADDVGLGKTVEAGLILQELLLRQRVDFALIVCPASVALQWRSEMQKRFGLSFEIYNRRFVAERRQERGFGINPWTTHSRFIVTYPMLRRPEYREPLIDHIGERIRKSLLILDEAHTAAPASASKYAVDSRTTRVIRDVAPRFENRLFLSATPHNGHSNSFSALLEILDPQRFTRGVPADAEQRDQVMVRRLKSELRELGIDGFPERRVIQIDLQHDDDQWHAFWEQTSTDGKEQPDPMPIGQAGAPELELSELLAEYSALVRPKKGRGKLVLVNLQKRLLSSIEAFHRTLRQHAASLEKRSRNDRFSEIDHSVRVEDAVSDEYGASDEELDHLEDLSIRARSSHLRKPTGRAKKLLDTMQDLAGRYRSAPDAKALALLRWIQDHQCSAVRIGGSLGKAEAWSHRRVIIFTEYGDTKRYLVDLLNASICGTDRAESRIMHFHGGMSDEQREEVQRAFNAPPAEHPVRILVATDAAREGVNLQGHCADLFHYDIPWNPARMEQRNGRIDRTLQPAAEVRCHYFFYRQRAEDAVLRQLVRKVDTIHRELGSLGSVVMDAIETSLRDGLNGDAAESWGDAAGFAPRKNTIEEELSSSDSSALKLRQKELNDAARILDKSRAVMDFDSELLRDALNVGLELAGQQQLQHIVGGQAGSLEAYTMPDLPASWQATIDTIRPPRERDEEFWAWRTRDPLPVVFRPPETMTQGVAHLHLHHPVVRRVLSRFISQGFSTHDLSRVTVVRTRRDSLIRVIAFGRLSLFGAGATRLHDEVIAVSAQWLPGGGEKHLKPFAADADRRALDSLEDVLRECPELKVNAKVQQQLKSAAAGDFATLWHHIEGEGEARARQAEQKLQKRAQHEAEALTGILERQRVRIRRTIDAKQLSFGDNEREQRRQYERDQKHMRERLAKIDQELSTEPAELQDLYRVELRRLSPVGLIYLWPESRG
ncbi:MAG: DISARM system SNF2-like helicase DrmD [Myxococcota bacterium]